MTLFKFMIAPNLPSLGGGFMVIRDNANERDALKAAIYQEYLLPTGQWGDKVHYYPTFVEAVTALVDYLDIMEEPKFTPDEIQEGERLRGALQDLLRLDNGDTLRNAARSNR